MNPEACAEVIDILKYIPKPDYDKIPKDYLDSLYQNANETSDFSYNAALPFSKQNISDEAKKILSYISSSFWK